VAFFMVCSGRYNLCIPQGSTYLNTFIFRHKIALTVAANSGATTLNITSLQHEILSGATLTFGTTTVTLSSTAAVGDRTLSVNAISAEIAKGTSANGDLIDFTGKTARAAIRANYTDTNPLATFTCTIATPTNGEIAIALPSTSTSAIAANIHPDKADDIVDLQANTFPSTTEARLFLPGLSPYYWDLEVFDTGSPPQVTRYLYGRVIVTAEATK
jgi:hypothetical protein